MESGDLVKIKVGEDKGWCCLSITFLVEVEFWLWQSFLINFRPFSFSFPSPSAKNTKAPERDMHGDYGSSSTARSQEADESQWKTQFSFEKGQECQERERTTSLFILCFFFNFFPKVAFLEYLLFCFSTSTARRLNRRVCERSSIRQAANASKAFRKEKGWFGWIWLWLGGFGSLWLDL